MCLIVFAYKTHPNYQLVLAANRDEFYDRPTSIAGWWEDYPDVLGGRDLQAMGTWMGMSKNGRFASVTNYRDLSNIKEDAKSRGDLPVNFLTGDQSAKAYGHELEETGAQYNGYNLLAFDDSMVHFSNYENKVNELGSGIYGLSNALLDTPWPKVQKSKKRLSELMGTGFELEDLITMMQDEEVANDDQLPSTGLTLEKERALSPMSIRTDGYGTCCTTALTIDNEGQVRFIEKSYPFGSGKEGSEYFTFKIEK